MLSTLKKDKNRRTLVKKYEIRKLYAKVFQQDLLLKRVLEKNSTIASISSNNFGESAKDIIGLDKQKIALHDFLYEKAIYTIPRNSSKSRIKNRCIKSGRSRGVLSFCKLSRICFREEASKAKIPGVQKASW